MRSLLTSLFLALVATLSGAGAHAQSFAELAAQERTVLQPLSGEWDAMSATRKKKWRELAERYPKLSPEEQQRLTARMQGWSRMSPEDRRAARDQFRDIQGAPGAPAQGREQLKKQWQQYRDLPQEERNRLSQERLGTRPAQGRNAETVKRAGTPPLPSQTAPVSPVSARPAR
jgi:hypothetical protein